MSRNYSIGGIVNNTVTMLYGDCTYHGEPSLMYGVVKSLCHAPDINIAL